MNVPLKKRYNYCPIINGSGALAIEQGAMLPHAMAQAEATATTMDEFIPKQENNNDDKEEPICIDDDSMSIGAVSASKMPLLVKAIDSIQFEPDYVENSDVDLKPTLLAANFHDYLPSTFPMSMASKPISLNTTTSSAAANTSSSSNKTFAMSEKEETDSTDDSDGSQEHSFGKKNEAFGPRLHNKHFTEANVKQNELLNPGMTTRDRVMYWYITEEFSELDDDIDLDDTKIIAAFRSERLQIKSYQRNRSTAAKSVKSMKSVKSAKSVKSMKSAKTAPIPAVKRAKSTISPPSKRSKADETPPKQTEVNGNGLNIDQSRSFGSKRSSSHENLTTTPRKRSLLNHLVHEDAKLKNKNTSSSAIKLRVDYAKKSLGYEMSGSFKIPEAPGIRNAHIDAYLQQNADRSFNHDDLVGLFESRGSPSSLNDLVGGSNNQEEFYKYLGIDTNPCHEKQSPEGSAEDSRSSSNKRRSLRVKIQQKVSKLNEVNSSKISPNSAMRKGGKLDTSPVGRNGIIVPRNIDFLIDRNAQENGLSSLDSSSPSPRGENSCPNSSTPGESKLIKISYVKHGSSKTNPDAFNKSIVKEENGVENIPAASDGVPTTEMLEIKVEQEQSEATNSHIVDRRFYEPIDSPSSTGTAPFFFGDTTEVQNGQQKTPKKTSGTIIATIDLTDTPEDEARVSSNVDQTKSTRTLEPSVDDHSRPAANESSSVAVKRENLKSNDPYLNGNAVTAGEVGASSTTNKEPKVERISPTPSSSNVAETQSANPSSGSVVNESSQGLAKRKPVNKKKILLTEMFKRYEKCLQKTALFKMQVRKKRSLKRLQTTEARVETTVESATESPSTKSPAAEVPDRTATPNNDTNKPETVLQSEKPIDIPIKLPSPVPVIQRVTDQPPNMVNGNLATPPISHETNSQVPNLCKDVSNSIIPPSTDSATVIGLGVKSDKVTETSNPSANCVMGQPPVIRTCISTIAPLSHARNPLNIEDGIVLGAFVVTTTANSEVILVVQQNLISFWKMTPKIYNIFGVPRGCQLMGSKRRCLNDVEIDVPYQNRIILTDDNLPAYVEFRGRELSQNEARECLLTSVYANVYFMKDSRELSLQSVQLDTLKSSISNITYLAIPNSTFIAMAWTEQTVLNRSRGGVCKYSLRYPGFETLQNILDFSYVHDAVKNLSCLNDSKLLGCGTSHVMMWDHRNGDLLMSLDMNMPIGVNLGCFMMDDVDYLFLIQFFQKTEPAEQNMLKLLAISTASTFTWRVVQMHTLPDYFKTVTSTFLSTEDLAVTFENGHSLLMNLNSPQYLYMVDEFKGDTLKNRTLNETGAVHAVDSRSDKRVFVRGGQFVQISSESLITKSLCEHFIINK